MKDTLHSVAELEFLQFFRTQKKTIAKPMLTLLKKSLDMGIIPSPMKQGNIIPIYKEGNEGLPKKTTEAKISCSENIKGGRKKSST